MDFRLASNRLALAVPVVAGGIAGLATLIMGDTLSVALRTGVAAGGASFLGWALAREVDPDRTLTAAITAVGSPFMVLLGDPAIASGFVWVMALRALSGTTGVPVFVPDLVVLALVAALAALGEGGFTAVAIGLVVMALSTVTDPTNRARVVVACLLIAGMAAAISAARGHLVAPAESNAATAWWLVAIVVGALAAIRVRVTTMTDRRPRPVSQTRVRMAIASGAVGCLVVVAWHGPEGAYRAGPLLAALWVTGIVALWPRGGTAT